MGDPINGNFFYYLLRSGGIEIYCSLSSKSGPAFWWIINIITGNLKHRSYRHHPVVEDLWWNPGIHTSTHVQESLS